MNDMGFKEEHLVSVIIPVYNVKKYLKECIESVIRQSYTKLEIILIDDGSDDGSEFLCDELKEKDSRIVVVHQNNKGLSGARNTGLDIAAGEYIFLLDSDDVIHKSTIEILYNCICQTNTGVVVGSFKTIMENEVADITESLSICDSATKTGKEMLLDFYKSSDYYFRISMITAWGTLYKKSCFQKMRYPLGRYHEDEYVTYRIIYESETVCYLPVRLYYYRQRNGSIMTSISVMRRVDDTLDAFIAKAAYFFNHKEKELYDWEVINILRYIWNTKIQVAEDIDNQRIHAKLKQCFRQFYHVKINRKLLTYREKLRFYLFFHFNAVTTAIFRFRTKKHI